MSPNVVRPQQNHDVTTSITNQIENGAHLGLAKVSYISLVMNLLIEYKSLPSLAEKHEIINRCWLVSVELFIRYKEVVHSNTSSHH